MTKKILELGYSCPCYKTLTVFGCVSITHLYGIVEMYNHAKFKYCLKQKKRRQKYYLSQQKVNQLRTYCSVCFTLVILKINWLKHK